VDLPVGRSGEIDLVQDVRHDRGVQPGGDADRLQMGAGGQAGMEGRHLQHRADRGDRPVQFAVRRAADGRGACRGGDQSEDHAQGGGLSRPVGAEEGRYRARFDGERQVVDGVDVAERLAQVDDADGWHDPDGDSSGGGDS
jgi:hypothetical protein